jgi:hypothetical protein
MLDKSRGNHLPYIISVPHVLGRAIENGGDGWRGGGGKLRVGYARIASKLERLRALAYDKEHNNAEAKRKDDRYAPRLRKWPKDP